MNRALFNYEMKKGGKILLIFMAILIMYIVCIIWMFDPEMMKSLEQIYLSMPQIMSAVGMKVTSTTLIGFMISYLYGFIMVVFPMIYTILRSRTLLADKVEKKSMASLLSAPISRRKVVQTQIGVLNTGIILLMTFATLVEIAFCQIWFPGELNIIKLLAVNVGMFALHFFIGGLCMISSAACNDAGIATGVCGGICAVMFLVQMIRNIEISDVLDYLKYCTFFTLFNPNGIIEGALPALSGIAILFIGGLAMYISSGFVFCNRDLPL